MEGVFGDQPHTAWEEYQKTMQSKPYKTIMNGKCYPKRWENTDKSQHYSTQLSQWDHVTSKEVMAKRNKSMSAFRETVY